MNIPLFMELLFTVALTPSGAAELLVCALKTIPGPKVGNGHHDWPPLLPQFRMECMQMWHTVTGCSSNANTSTSDSFSWSCVTGHYRGQQPQRRHSMVLQLNMLASTTLSWMQLVALLVLISQLECADPWELWWVRFGTCVVSKHAKKLGFLIV